MYNFSAHSLWIFRIILFCACLFMTYLAITTYQQYPLHKQGSQILKLTWMATTLIDFYLNVALIYLWVFLKEATIIGKLIWLCILIVTGSIGTTFYLLLKTFELAPGDSVAKLLLP